MSGKKIIFVTGTDTGVGKTLLTAVLLRHLREVGCHALAMKPFCSGGRGDVRMLQSLQRGELSEAEMNPFYFGAPVAPLVELKKLRKDIPLKEVVAKIRAVERKCEQLLVEGSGGLMVPLGKTYLVEDLIVKLKCRVVVVARNRLGTINHTLLTVERLRRRGVKSANMAVVLMGGPAKDASSPTNAAILQDLLPGIAVLRLPNMHKTTAGIEKTRVIPRSARAVLNRLLAVID